MASLVNPHSLLIPAWQSIGLKPRPSVKLSSSKGDPK
jgi:hypothetical protein